MAHNSLHGIARNAVHGTKLQGALTLGTSMAGVTKDATSAIYCPVSSAEWTTTMAAAGLGSGNPSFGWGFQDASGNPAALFGGVTLTAAGTGAVYQTVVSGWSRFAITASDGATQSFSSTSASLPDLSTTSQLMLVYYSFGTAPISQRGLMFYGGTGICEMRGDSTPRINIVAGSAANGVNNYANAVRPLVLKYDKTNSVIAGYTNQEKLTPIFGALTGKKVLVGNTGARFWCTGGYLYAVVFTGTAAELTDAQVKTLLTTLGWTIPWS